MIKYFDLIIAIAIAFILIKFISNYKIMFSYLGNLWSIITPFIFSFVVAYILNPLMKVFEKRFNLKRGVSILLTYIMLLVILGIIITVLIPKVYLNIIDMIKSIPYLADTTQQWVNTFLSNPLVRNVIKTTDLKIKPDIVISKLSDFTMYILNTLLSKTWSFTNCFLKWIFGFIISIYVLCDKEKFIAFGKKIIYIVFKEKKGNSLLEFARTMNNMIGTYIGIKAIDSTIIGIIAFVGLSILKSPYAILIAVIVGITNMIPYFGPFLGMLVAFIINIFFNVTRSFLVLIFLFCLQQFDGWYLDPKLVGGRVGLRPFLVIFAVTLGGGFYGPVGMILSVPIMAVLKIYIDRLLKEYDKRIEERKYGQDKKEEK